MTWALQNWRVIAVAVLLAACVAAGWIGRGWFEDAQDLAELRGAQQAIDAAMQRESGIASALETRLQELKANERVIEREKIKVVDRPVYRAECLDADGLRLINAAKAGTGAGKPAGAVSATR